ncbi:Glycosyl hydrolase family 79, N-terminal domain [Nesidiocoris tenuis]|uniref:Glycosyl hydrolase family 79, N-terminal domain n=1 Tax=Nesidiocoris tenuis TaxID=355587 RepID=A0ABN7AZY0_9HEMI|nr:Glycosyl hydrolase family 79, N-terminal domain [Nesidiocoris tenuis]
MVACIVFYLLMMLYVQRLSGLKQANRDPPAVAYVPWLSTKPEHVFNFHIAQNQVLHKIDKRFLSFAIDTNQIRKGPIHPSLWDTKLRRSMRHLSGGYIRFGGTAADLLVFSPSLNHISPLITPADDKIMGDGGECSFTLDCHPSLSLESVKKFSMNADNWKAINLFAKAIDMRLLFDLNVLLRGNGGWNSSNAELLLDFAFAYHYNMDFELGNEPNSFKKLFGVNLPAQNLSADYAALRTLLNRYTLYNSSFLVGPSVTNPRMSDVGSLNSAVYDTMKPDVYLANFLQAGADVDAVTWHHYYLGPEATTEDYLDVNTFNSFISNCRRMVDIVKINSPLKPIWIGETGSSYGGGAPGLSDRFVASLLWTDKLGVAAREGISVIIRQSVYSGHYALLGEELSPNPDYWISILHKRLVGKRVLNATCTDAVYDHTLRVYAHCAVDSKLTVFGVNIANAFLGLSLKINATANLYSVSSSLDSSVVYLNGELLILDPDYQELPDFHPVLVNTSDPIPIPPYSVFFLHVDLTLPACGN